MYLKKHSTLIKQMPIIEIISAQNINDIVHMLCVSSHVEHMGRHRLDMFKIIRCNNLVRVPCFCSIFKLWVSIAGYDLRCHLYSIIGYFL